VSPDEPWVPTLVGSRCTLRALQPGDAPAIALHANDAAVVHNLYDGFPHPYTMQEAQRWCGAMHREPHFGKVWAITVAGRPEEAIGCTGLIPKEGMHACNAEVGYWIGRAHWGRGLAAEALALLTQWAWAGLPVVQRLVAPIYARNTTSQRVAVKAGYVLEALQPRSLLKGGQAIDVTVYAAYRP